MAPPRRQSWGSGSKPTKAKKGADQPEPAIKTEKKPKPTKVAETAKVVEKTADAQPTQQPAPSYSTKIWMPPTPAIIVPKKSALDRVTARFSNMLPDIDDLTQKIIASDLDHTQAIEVMTRADDLVDWAPNVLSWCADKRFVGMRPFAKQAEILLHIFEEWCPNCSDNDYVQDIPLADSIETVMAKIALLEFGKCPHCGFLKGDGRRSGVFKDPLELIAIVGQRAGKSAVASLAISYLIHRNAMLPVPWKSYGLTPGQIIDFTIVATTVSQAEKSLWSTFKGIFENSPWFKAYKLVSDEEGKKSGIKATIVVADTYIWFEHKRILVYFAANNPSSLRGTTRFGAAIDELGWFNAEQGSLKQRANGPETYAALSNACLTLRAAFRDAVTADPNTNCPVPLMLNISSPRSMDDAIMSIYRDTAGSKRVVRKHWATWEMNPTLPKSLLIETGDLLKPNGVRDYAAQPPLADDPLVRRVDTVTEAFKNPLATEKRYGAIIRSSAQGGLVDLDVQSGKHIQKMLSAELDMNVEAPNYALLKQLPQEDLTDLGPHEKLFQELVKRPAVLRPHIMGVDLGSSNNALAVVAGYLSGDKFITDFVFEVKPESAHRVNMADVYTQLIVKLVESLNVVAVYYDTWSSLHQIQDLCMKYGSLGPLNPSHERRAWKRDLSHVKSRPAFIADQYSLNVADASMLVSRLEQGDCLFPAMEVNMMELMVNKALDPSDYPFAHLALQMATVRVRGNRLLKPVNRDDDLFRAWANAAVKAFRDELVIDMLKQEGRTKLTRGKANISGHVSLGMTGKGLRQVASMQGGAHSNSGVSGFPIIVKKGTFGALKG